jgi:hypothetical protein
MPAKLSHAMECVSAHPASTRQPSRPLAYPHTARMSLCVPATRGNQQPMHVCRVSARPGSEAAPPPHPCHRTACPQCAQIERRLSMSSQHAGLTSDERHARSPQRLVRLASSGSSGAACACARSPSVPAARWEDAQPRQYRVSRHATPHVRRRASTPAAEMAEMPPHDPSTSHDQPLGGLLGGGPSLKAVNASRHTSS